LKWLYLRGVYHNVSNINKINILDGKIELCLRGDTPTIYYGITKQEIDIINKLVNNESTRSS